MLAHQQRFSWWKTELLTDASGSQLLEFAVALPLLMVLVVGIFDFGEAFNVKQKMNNITREAARFASTLPTNDLDTPGTPPSVTAIHDLVEGQLQAGRMNDCGLGLLASATPPTFPAQIWTYTPPLGACPAPGLVLTIDRSYAFDSVVGTDTFKVISTRVTLQYPYQLKFNRVIGLLTPGANYSINKISTDATMPNME